MCDAYGIAWNSPRQKVARPAASNHTRGDAIDMKMSNYVGKSVKNADGELIEVTGFSTLVAIENHMA